ncbi:zf-DHHC-domain-containing protein [Exidia glandulosa HHB12029]|uniref:Palmitoyltransferase n=1 Tax=Exidia glandulosa HHB12029 TaxID=1314781 RepID=A0A165N9Q1_EXIGL|nr:zf-DHHC-domain-containing protein [Exidia glandulosa HHB12029]
MSNDDGASQGGRRWYHFIPLCFAVLIILSPHPSLIVLLTSFQLQTLNSPLLFVTHILVIYSLTFMAYSSLIVCVVRDPGPVGPPPAADEDSEETTLTDALRSIKAADDDYDKPGRWCRRCWAPKPERAHHCSICDRCVLKMDHHCPWMGGRCIGHRTYPSFVHFIFTTTMLSVYVAGVAISALYYIIKHPYELGETVPLHVLLLVVLGGAFTLMMGSFAGYHAYLISTNQTTIEHLSPFLLLRFLPEPLPPPSRTANNQTLTAEQQDSPYYFPSPVEPRPPWVPQEHELSYKQRRMVQRAHEKLRMYDLGFKRNWAAIFGVPELSGKRNHARWKLWAARILWGGGAALGDGRTFPANPRADSQLAELAMKLYGEDDQRPRDSSASSDA